MLAVQSIVGTIKSLLENLSSFSRHKIKCANIFLLRIVNCPVLSRHKMECANIFLPKVCDQLFALPMFFKIRNNVEIKCSLTFGV